MAVRKLEIMLNPASIVLIGASPSATPVSAILARNLSSAGFKGPLFAVIEGREAVEGFRSYPDLSSLPEPADLAVIAAPPRVAARHIEELRVRGIKAAVIVPTGHGRTEQDTDLQSAVSKSAGPHLLRVVGPNSMGIIVPGAFLNASLFHIQPIPGNLAFVGQSAGVQSAMLDWATSRGIGFSHFVALGGTVDVDFGDILGYLANESRVRAILLHLETIKNARKFLSSARMAARMKPVIVLKGGLHPESPQAAPACPGGELEPDAVYDAAFRRAGMLRVYSIRELFDAVETLAMVRPGPGERLAILGNGEGISALAMDRLAAEKGRLADLSPQTRARLNAVLPPDGSAGNPVNVTGGASPELYSGALEALCFDGGVDAVLVLHSPSAFSSGVEVAQAVIDTFTKCTARPKPYILTSWLGGRAAAPARELFVRNRIPTYQSPTDAVRGFMHLVHYRRSQEALMETPPGIPQGFTPDLEAVHRIATSAISDGRGLLTKSECEEILAAYRIPVARTWRAATAEEAASIAAGIGQPVVLRVVPPEPALHNGACGISLNLETPDMVREATGAMLECIQRACPEAESGGFTVQLMVHRSGGHELMVGVKLDAVFGPMLLFGQGGADAELLQDRALALPPLNVQLSREVMARTRIYPVLERCGGISAANIDSIALTLVKTSKLVCDIPEIVELEINPLLAGSSGVFALDARIRVAPATRPAADRLAISPYPKELESTITLPDGQTMQIRPIRPEDEPAYQKVFASLTPEEMRMRFLHPVKVLSHELAARLTQIDYDREMALVLADRAPSGETEIYGGVRISADPDGERAEFAIVLHHDMTGLGLGPMLLRRIIDYARSKGIREIYGDVLSDNTPMLKMCRMFGFTLKRDPDDPGVMSVSLKL